MPAWLKKLLADPTAQTAITRGMMILLAYLFHNGTVPTGHDGAGDMVAAVLATVAAAIPAGEKNLPIILQRQAPPPPAPPVP